MRALGRSVAWLILAGFLAAQASVWVAAHHATLEDDSACAAAEGSQMVGPHHQSGPQFEEPNHPNPIEHCAICHLQRVVSHARLVRINMATAAAQRLSGPVEADRAVALVVLPPAPSRGPPAFFA